MSTVEKTQATIEDLYLVEGKAELVHGKVETMSPSGFRHLRMNDTIVESLRLYERSTRSGFACGDGGGFLCDLPHRKSFSPDSSYYTGEIPQNPDDFLPEPPTFAVEIRSKNDKGPKSLQRMAEKRQDYFAAGTKAVWDVDPDGPVVIRLYLAGSPESPLEFRRGEIAHAEPVLSGWKLPVDSLFD